MALLYTTIAQDARVEQIIERSRFIAQIKRVASKEEADAFIESVRAEYRDATHNVPAFVIGDKMQLQWASDDGEPQGTAGAPIVQMLVKEGITNVLVVVTRYFGGIKLGTGGLVRAYTSSASLALEAAGREDVREIISQTVVMSYEEHARFGYISGRELVNVKDTVFTDKVELILEYDADDETGVQEMLSNLLKKAAT